MRIGAGTNFFFFYCRRERVAQFTNVSVNLNFTGVFSPGGGKLAQFVHSQQYSAVFLRKAFYIVISAFKTR